MADQLDPALVAQISEQLRRSMGGALVQVGNDLTKLDRISKDVVSSSGGIGKLDSAFMGLTTRMLGPIGLVAGLYQVSNALSNVAAQSVQLQAFSRNTGIAADNIQNMQLQLQMMGKSSEEAKATVGQLAGLLNDFNTNRQGSSLSQTLLGREGGAAVIRDLNAAKNVTEQIAVMLKAYQNQPTERQRRGVAEAFGMDPASIEQLIKDQNLVALTFKANEEALERYHRASVIFTNNIDQAYKAMSGHVVAALNDIMGGAEDSQKTFATVVKGFTDSVDTLFDGRSFGSDFWESKFNFGGLKQDIKDVKDFFQWFTSLPNVGEDKKFRYFPGSAGGAYPQGDDPMGDDYTNRSKATSPWQMRGKLPALDLRRGGTSDATDFSGMRRAQSLEEEQATTLTDIRDTLKRIEDKGGGGSNGGETWGGGGRGSLASRSGMYNPEGIPGMPGSPRGNTSGVGSERGRVGAGGDPRGMESYIREAAKARGIDPDTAVAVAKSEGLSTFQSSVKSEKGPNGREDSWGAFQLYKGGGLGNEFQKKTGLDPADPQNERATIDFALDHASKKGWGAFHGAKNTGIDRFAGIGANSPGRPAYSGGNGDGLPSAVLDEAKKVAASDGPGAVQNYIRSQGYNVNSAWCGDFAAAVVSASGGKPPEGHSIASNWRKFGHQVDEPQPGDIAVRKSSRFGSGYTPTGATGSHVTIFEGADGKGRFTGIGGNQSGRRSSFPMSGYEYFRGNAEEQAARSRMDAAKNSGTENSLNAKVEFSNVPPGVKTSVESEGEIFKELQVSKSKQGEVAGGSPGQPFSGVW